MPFLIKRKKTRQIKVGNVKVGGTAPVAVQSMTNTFTQDIPTTVSQIHRLEKAGCEIVRVAVPDHEAAKAISSIKQRISIPIIADIHFDYRLAVASVSQAPTACELTREISVVKKKSKRLLIAQRTFTSRFESGLIPAPLKKIS